MCMISSIEACDLDLTRFSQDLHCTYHLVNHTILGILLIFKLHGYVNS